MDIVIQREVINTLLEDIDILKKVRHSLPPEYISAPHLKWTLKNLYLFFDEYSSLPDIHYFKLRLNQDRRVSTEDKNRYFSLLKSLFENTETQTNRKFALDEILKYVQKQKITEILEKSINHLELDEIEEVVRTASSITKVKLYKQEYTISNWLSNFETRQQERQTRKTNPSASNIIPFPWETVNKFLGGVQPGETACFASLTNVGKSIVLMLCGKKAFLEGYNIAHFVTENSLWQTEQRYDSSILGIEYDKLKYYNLSNTELTEIEDIIFQIRKVIGDRLRIIKLQPRRASIVTMEQALSELEDSGFVPDLLIIDSADHLIAEKYKDRDYRLEQTEVYWDIKTLADLRSIPTITSTQAGKVWKGKVAPAEALAEAYDKARILDIVFTLNQLTEDSPEILFKIAKARDSKKGQEIPMLAKYELMDLVELSLMSP